MLSKALLGFSVPDNQPSMTAHYKPAHELKLNLSMLLSMPTTKLNGRVHIGFTLSAALTLARTITLTRTLISLLTRTLTLTLM